MKLNCDFTNRGKLSDVGRWYVNNFVQFSKNRLTQWRN